MSISPYLRAFSYSSLKQFETCPRQYGEITVHRNYKNVFTSTKGEYGDRLHKAAQTYIDAKTQLEPEFAFVGPILDNIIRLPGVKYVEHKMAVTHEGFTCEWNSSYRWFQGIADLVVVGETPIARCLDWKTGNSKYADTDQLELMALLVFSHFPHVKLVKGALVFVLDEVLKKRDVDISERDRLLQKYREKDAKRLAAIEKNKFPARSNGLCKKHCVVVSCEHNGNH